MARNDDSGQSAAGPDSGSARPKSAWSRAVTERATRPATAQPAPAPPTAAAVAAPAGADQERLELERRIRHLTLSRDLTKEFVSTTDLKQLMGVIFERVLNAIGAEAGSLWLVDFRTRENVCHQAEGPAKEKVIGLKLPPGKGVVGEVIRGKQPEVVLDTACDRRFDAEVDKASGFQTRSMICVPLVVDAQVYGAIQVINKKGGFENRFSPDDILLVEDLANSAAVSIKNARLIETESKVKEMGILLRISREISSTLNLNQVLAMVVNMTGELVEMTGGAAALWDDEKQRLALAELSHQREIDPKDARQQQLLALMERIRQAGRTVSVEDLETFGKRPKTEEYVAYMETGGLVSAWGTPLADEEGVLGVLWFESDKPRLAEGGKADLLSILANQAGVAVRNANLYHRVPFMDTLGRVAEKSQKAFGAWRKWAAAAAVLVLAAGVLHFTPYFQSVTGDCEVEARLGYGVFLQVGGTLAHVLVKEGDQVDAGQVVARLDPLLFRLAHTQAMTQLAVIERKIVEARAMANPAEMRRLLTEREALRAEAAKAAEDLDKVEVRAPRKGIVLTPRLSELEGAALGPGAEVMRLADPDQLTMVVQVEEEDVLSVAAGQEVVGVVRSAPGQRFRGRVAHIGRAWSLPPEAAVAKDSSEEDIRRKGFLAEVEVFESPAALRPGMTGKARIMTPGVSTLQRHWLRVANTFVFWFGP
ncbi:MAG: GAF domain-containing protein [Thermodesulfobacteriota bacterium]